MSKSIISGNRKGVCLICRRIGQTEEHHIFGSGNRKKADREGLTAYLCHNCHNEPPNGVHFNRERNIHLKQIGQLAWMNYYGKTTADFIREYGKNYIYDNAEHCISCGDIIPEGRTVCPNCEVDNG